MDDRQIVELYFERSESAISETDKKYGRACLRLSENIVGNRLDAEECVNDTYLGVWNAVPPTEPDPLSTFIFKITRNLSLTRYRANTAQKRNSFYDVALDELSECLGQVDEHDEGIATDAIERFLDTLAKDNRVIFVRRYWFFESYSEIAKHVGLSEKAVSMRLARTREALREFLTGEGIWI